MTTGASTVLDAVESYLDDVANVGKVYAYTRIAADANWSNFQSLFGVTIAGQSQYRGWCVTLDEREPIAHTVNQFGEVERTYNVLVWGVLGFKDSLASERTFYDLIGVILDALDDAGDLGLTVRVVKGTGPWSCRLCQLRTFGSVAAHYAEIVGGITVACT